MHAPVRPWCRSGIPVSGGRLAAHLAALTALVALGGGLVAAVPAGASTPSGSAGSTQTVPVPVLGSTTIAADRDARNPVLTALVHGVRRIPGGTVLYFSMGAPAGTTGSTSAFSVTNNLGLRNRIASGSTPLGSQLVVDVVRKKVYSTLVDADRNALASPASAFGRDPGKLFVYYEVLPELPAGTTTVDVSLGHVDVVPDVPVSSGLLEPAQQQTGPIELGRPWPRVDLTAVAESYQPAQGIYNWSTEVSALDGSLTTREQPDQVSVDLSADVLFDVDRATLTPRAAATLRRAAAQVDDRAAAGTVRIVGHTDSTGTDGYNDDLSRRRAAAVEQALKPLVQAAGVGFTVEGRGEREPVRSNSTGPGRQANRRVSVSFSPREGG